MRMIIMFNCGSEQLLFERCPSVILHIPIVHMGSASSLAIAVTTDKAKRPIVYLTAAAPGSMIRGSGSILSPTFRSYSSFTQRSLSATPPCSTHMHVHGNGLIVGGLCAMSAGGRSDRSRPQGDHLHLGGNRGQQPGHQGGGGILQGQEAHHHHRDRSCAPCVFVPVLVMYSHTTSHVCMTETCIVEYRVQ